MKELILNIKGMPFFAPALFVNGKRVRVKRQKDGTRRAVVSCDTAYAQVRFKRFFEVESPLFPLFSVLFFLLSGLGIFDLRASRDCRDLDLSFTLPLSGRDELFLSFLPFAADTPAVFVNGGTPVSFAANRYLLNETVRTRLKKEKIFRHIARILGLAALAAFLIFRLRK